MTGFNVQQISQLDRSRFADYKANLDFYNGEQWAERSDTSRRSGRQLVFNYAKIAIDKVTSYLVEGLNFACEPIENQTSDIKNQKDMARKAEQVIYQVYAQNDLQELDYETEVDTAILGDGCYKVTWDAQEKRIRVTSPDVNGGIRLHVDYIDMIYRCLHDISEAPRAAYGGIERELSGVALEVELQSLLQKVRRKRTIRSAAYIRRCQMILALHKQFAGPSPSAQEDLTSVNTRIIWGAVLPQDRARLAQNEQLLVQSGVHSRRTAMDELGIRDPEAELARWLEERKQILAMNQQYKARSTRGGERARVVAVETESESLTE
jgi:hypothetical protein